MRNPRVQKWLFVTCTQRPYFSSNFDGFSLNEFIRKILFRKMHRVIIRYVTITVFDIKGAKKGEISIFFTFLFYPTLMLHNDLVNGLLMGYKIICYFVSKKV